VPRLHAFAVDRAGGEDAARMPMPEAGSDAAAFMPMPEGGPAGSAQS